MSPDRPDIAFFPPAGLLAAILAAALLEWLLPVGLLPPPLTPLTFVSGLALAAAGIGLAVWGDRAFKRAGTNVNPRRPVLHLVEDGPYRFTRNPMYVGMVLLVLGIGLAASLDWAIPAALGLWAALHFGVVRREEAFLTARFGAPYIALLARTRRWL